MTETDEQKILVYWFRTTWPEHRKCIRASMAGINYGSGKRGSVMKNFTRSMGVEEGESDLMFLCPKGKWHGLVIEHKSAAGDHKLTDEQKEYLEYYHNLGFYVTCTKGVEEARKIINEYMQETLFINLLRNSTLQER